MKSLVSISNMPGMLGAVFLGGFCAASAMAESLLESIDQEVRALYERSKYAVVKVHASHPYLATNRQTIQWQRVGSGFFIDTNGTVLTTSSVVDQGETFWIEWGNQKIPMTLVGSDAMSRLAVLKIDAERYPSAQIKTPVLPIGDVNDLRIGSMVIAIGYLYDLPSSPSVGFVGGFDIRCGSHVFLTTHVRSTCKLSPGQQGGPLLNARGEVVGVPVAAHLDDQCFAVPINAARRVWSELLERGRVDYGWIGLTITERPVASAVATNGVAGPDFAPPLTQVIVTQVLSNTPAAVAGLATGDIVLRVHTNDVRRVADMLNTMFGYRDGDQLPMTILRNDTEHHITLQVAPRQTRPIQVVRPPAPPSTTNTATAVRTLPVSPVSADQPK